MKAIKAVTAPDPLARANVDMQAMRSLTARAEEDEADGERAEPGLQATRRLTAVAGLVDQIRILYRLAKAAEQARIRIDLGLYAFARVHLTAWRPDDEPEDRRKAAAQAKRVVDAIREDKAPADADAPLYAAMLLMVTSAQGSWMAFETARKDSRKAAEKLARQLPAWTALEPIRGFSCWGLTAIVGEAGDVGRYPGCRHLYKRLGLAPDACYPTGEQRTGRKIPRHTRGRIMGIIADPLLRAQWRGAREADADESHKINESHDSFDFGSNGAGGGGSLTTAESHGAVDHAAPTAIPAHAIGPYGAVYGAAKARHLAAERTRGHAEKLARRAMVKALLHDVHDAWHGRPLTFMSEKEGGPAWS